jgi:hypothetical protein
VYLFFSWLLKVEQLSVLASIRGKLTGWRQKLSTTTEVITMEET